MSPTERSIDDLHQAKLLNTPTERLEEVRPRRSLKAALNGEGAWL